MFLKKAITTETQCMKTNSRVEFLTWNSDKMQKVWELVGGKKVDVYS